MRLGPLVLGGASLVLSFVCGPVSHGLVAPAATAISGAPSHAELHLWSGVNTAFLISLGTLALGIGFYFARPVFLRAAHRLSALAALGPDRTYERIFSGVLGFAGVTRRRSTK